MRAGLCGGHSAYGGFEYMTFETTEHTVYLFTIPNGHAELALSISHSYLHADMVYRIDNIDRVKAVSG